MSDTKTESIVSSAEADDEGATDAQQVSAPMDYKPPPRFVMWHRRYRPQWAERGTVSVPLSCGHEWMFKDDAPVAEIDCEYCAKKCAVPRRNVLHRVRFALLECPIDQRRPIRLQEHIQLRPEAGTHDLGDLELAGDCSAFLGLGLSGFDCDRGIEIGFGETSLSFCRLVRIPQVGVGGIE